MHYLRKNILYALSGRIGLSLGFFQLRFFFESGLEVAFDTTEASPVPCVMTPNVSSGTFKFIVMVVMNDVLLRGVCFVDNTFSALSVTMLADRLYNDIMMTLFEKMSSLTSVSNVS